MSSSSSYRRLLLVLCSLAVVSYGWRLFAQQGGGLTPPPKPNGTKSAPAGSTTPSTSAVTTAPTTNGNGQAFQVGERLVYNVNWASHAVAARLELEVAGQGIFFGQESYQLRTKVETLGQVRSLFGDIDNQYTSYIGSKTALPHRVVNSIRQGEKQIEETVVFDHAKQQAIFSDDSMVNIPSGAVDFPSLIYSLRMRGLPGEKQKFSVLFGKEVIEFEAVVKGRERIATQSGTYNTVQLKFYPQNKPYSKYRGYVWFSDDAQRLPVVIQAKLSFGEVRAELSSATITVRPQAPLAKATPLSDESGTMPVPLPSGSDPRNGRPAGQQPAAERVYPFGVGERLNYEVSWGSFSAVGKASFEVRQQGMLGKQRVFEFYGEASSVGAARTLVNVNDQISSFVAVESLMPVRTDLRLREGRRTKQTSANYDWARKTATLTSGTGVALTAPTFDLLSLFYAIRAEDLKLGATYNFPFLDANFRMQMVVVRVVKQEDIGGPMGSRNALQLDILAPAPPNSLLAQVWLSNDARRLPLYLTTRTRFGEIRFQMLSASNTK